MKILFRWDKPHIIRLSLFVGAIIIVSCFFPREDKFAYEYSLGKPWTYSLLTAPFDMPINIDSVNAHKAKDSIDSHFIPIYYRDASTEKTNISHLYTALYSNSAIPGRVKNHLLDRVRRIYVDGIVDNDTYDDIVMGKLRNIRFIINNVAENAPVGSLRSVRQAYAALDSIFPDPDYQQAMASVQITNYLSPNVKYDSIESHRLIAQLYQKALAPVGIVQKGERIIDRGDKVTPQAFQILETYEKMMSDRSQANQSLHYPLVGQVAMAFLLFGCFYLFMIFFRRRTFGDTRKMIFLMSFLVAFTVGTFIVEEYFANAIYIIPFATIPIIVATFFDSRTAFFANTIVVLLCAIIAPFPLEFICLQMIGGIVAITSVEELSRRSQLVQCAFYIFIAYCLTYISITIIKEGNIAHISKHILAYFAMNAVVLSFAYVLIFVIEKFFGFISPVTLVEVSDVNSPLLRELSEACPGTFQHSLQVANLASEAAHRIGANVQLVRAGALYHDIGKIKNPAFFTENQRGVNPHTTLNNPEDSAKIVIAHVADGVALADKAKLPAVLKTFIQQHHGRGRARYFYTEACQKLGVDKVDPLKFTYPGPNPMTKETSILMMADATEAASKSLTDHSDEAITALVNKIIDTQIAEGMFSDSPISFRDVEIIKNTFSERLATFYHRRVSYPELDTGADV